MILAVTARLLEGTKDTTGFFQYWSTKFSPGHCTGSWDKSVLWVIGCFFHADSQSFRIHGFFSPEHEGFPSLAFLWPWPAPSPASPKSPCSKLTLRDVCLSFC